MFMPFRVIPQDTYSFKPSTRWRQSTLYFIDVSFFFLVQVALGSVTNVEEAVKWLSYTYLYVRMRANPLVYGINHKVFQVREQSTTPVLS